MVILDSLWSFQPETIGSCKPNFVYYDVVFTIKWVTYFATDTFLVHLHYSNFHSLLAIFKQSSIRGGKYTKSEKWRKSRLSATSLARRCHEKFEFIENSKNGIVCSCAHKKASIAWITPLVAGMFLVITCAEFTLILPVHQTQNKNKFQDCPLFHNKKETQISLKKLINSRVGR